MICQILNAARNAMQLMLIESLLKRTCKWAYPIYAKSIRECRHGNYLACTHVATGLSLLNPLRVLKEFGSLEAGGHAHSGLSETSLGGRFNNILVVKFKS